MEKLTDAEVVKALEICTDKLTISCPNDCPFYDECENDICALERHALDLIKRKDAEIEKLKTELVSADEVIGFREAEIERLKEAYLVYEETTGLKQAKSEAYKEFAEMLKERFSKEDYMLCDYEKDTIDNLLKELTGGNAHG